VAEHPMRIEFVFKLITNFIFRDLLRAYPSETPENSVVKNPFSGIKNTKSGTR
jgi:hypothetical protein